MGIEQKLYEKFGRTVAAGTVIFSEEEPGESMYIIQRGKVKVAKRIGSIDKTLVILSKGDFFGEMSILNDRPRSATAVAEEESDLLVIDREIFEAMIKGNPEIALRIIKKLAARIQEADNQIETLMIKDNAGKVANYIMRLASQAQQDKDGVNLGVGTDDVAGVLGLPRDIVSSIMTKLTKAHMVGMDSGNIVVTDSGQLERYVKYIEMKDSFGELT